MKQISKKMYIILSVLICAVAMSLVDGIWQPGYATKSAIKVILFLLVPGSYFFINRDALSRLRALFVPSRKDLLVALGLGAVVYCLILGGYHLINGLLPIDAIALELTSAGGVRPENFVAISLYISFVNSLLEEFLFRGFAFITLKHHCSRLFSYIFSAIVFAGYHFGMFASGYNPLIWFLAMAALFIAGCALNFLNEKSGNIYVSWLVHMFANFGINTVGFLVFGMI